MDFFGRLDFGPYGVLHPKIFTCARERPNRASAPPPGMAVPLEFFSKEGPKLA